jgi:heat shock protein HslJ
VKLVRIANRVSAVLLLTATPSVFAQTRPRPAPTLGGTSWRLVKFQGGDDKTLTPDDRSRYTIQFGADGSVSTRIDCNRGRGTWKSAGPSQIQFGPLAITRAMCPPGSLHDHIIKHWDFVRSYVVRNGHLYLSLMADGGIYEFEPIPVASPVRSLDETQWEVAGVDNGKQAVATPVQGTTLTLAFQKGSVVGVSGCNNYRGNYKQQGSSIAISGMGSTRRMCLGDGVMQQERRFLAALGAAATWAIEGDTLDLRRTDGSRLVQAKRVVK